MFKKLLLTTLLVVSANAKNYSIVIDVPNLKANGKNWDILGGSPDIMIKIDGISIPIFEDCKNNYRCVMKFYSNVNDWYIEVYDKDARTNDIIGRGNCSDNSTCEFSGIKMRIGE